jgi:replicative DNA helicase
MALYSLELEKHFLSAVINNPQAYFDLDGLIDEKCFYNPTHSVIFSVLRNLILADERFDKVILAQKIKNLGITLPDNLDVFDYINALSFLKVRPDAIKKTAQELIKCRIRRQIYQSAADIQKYIKEDNDETIDQVIANVESIFAKDISVFDVKDEIEYIYEDLENFIEEKGNNPVEDTGLLSGFYELDRMYGSFRNKNLYCFVSRSGEGKSTILHDLIYNICKGNDNVEALYMDTEMDADETKIRAACARTGVGFWYLDNGTWRKNPTLLSQTRDGLKNAGKPRIAYIKVGNKNIDQICSLARRWKLSKVKPGARTILCYDYIKLTGEKIGQQWAEYQAIGEKVDKLKKLAEFLDCPLLTAMQLNRSGDNFGKTGDLVTDDSTAIALSDRLLWFSSFVGIFRRKTLDEIALDGKQFGTHKLIVVKSRRQGRDSAGHQDFMKREFPDGTQKYVRNFINYTVDNFAVKECGSLKHVILAYKEQIDLAEKALNGDGTLI